MSSSAPGKILLMDDNATVRASLQRVITAVGGSIVTVSGGDEALAAYVEAAEQQSPFDVVVLDMTIEGGVGGLATIARLLEFDPEVRAVVMSGHLNDPVLVDPASAGFRAAAPKPIVISELLAAIERARKSAD